MIVSGTYVDCACFVSDMCVFCKWFVSDVRARSQFLTHKHWRNTDRTRTYHAPSTSKLRTNCASTAYNRARCAWKKIWTVQNRRSRTNPSPRTITYKNWCSTCETRMIYAHHWWITHKENCMRNSCVIRAQVQWDWAFTAFYPPSQHTHTHTHARIHARTRRMKPKVLPQ